MSRLPGRGQAVGYAQPPGNFKDWHELFQAYYAGMAKHNELDRSTRGRFQRQFSEEHGIPWYQINRVQRAYRLAFMQKGPHQKEAQRLFQLLMDGRIGPEALRTRLNVLMYSNGTPDPEVYRSAMHQVTYHLEQIELILSKLEQDIPSEISDDEVNDLARKIWNGRQRISTWYNRNIRQARPNALRRMEGKRP